LSCASFCIGMAWALQFKIWINLNSCNVKQLNFFEYNLVVDKIYVNMSFDILNLHDYYRIFRQCLDALKNQSILELCQIWRIIFQLLLLTPTCLALKWLVVVVVAVVIFQFLLNLLWRFKLKWLRTLLIFNQKIGINFWSTEDCSIDDQYGENINSRKRKGIMTHLKSLSSLFFMLQTQDWLGFLLSEEGLDMIGQISY
jgi:hypothetical protein